MSVLSNANKKGLLSARPSDNSTLKAGRIYWATDTAQVFYDDGTAWVDVTPGGGGIGTGTGTYFEEVITFSGSTATLSHTPITFTSLTEDGKKLRKVGSSPEFSLATATITLNYTPLSGGVYVASYWY